MNMQRSRLKFSVTLKNEYCKNNNIPLLIIRYDEVVEDKLELFLKQFM